MTESDIPDNGYSTDPDNDWTTRIYKGFRFAICCALIVLPFAYLLTLGRHSR